MAGFQADTDQLDQLARDLVAAGHRLEDLEPANAQAARAVVAAAQPPRRTGRLAGSLHADVTRQGVAFASSARYWTFVHWGAPRRHVRARPFYLEALDHNHDRVLAVYAQHVHDTLERL